LSSKSQHEKGIMNDERQQILGRVGLALIVFGSLDIGVMTYCIVHRISYSSSFNVFAVLAGVFVWKGHPWWVLRVRNAAAFFIAGFCVAPLIAPFIVPIDLVSVAVRLHPVRALFAVLVGTGIVVFLCWVYRQLSSPCIVRNESDQSKRSARAPFVLGAVVALAVVVLVSLGLHGADARTAIQLARSKVEPGYRFWVSSLSSENDHGRARVLAYDDRAIRTIEVEW
jgi:hypothetical protein